MVFSLGSTSRSASFISVHAVQSTSGIAYVHGSASVPALQSLHIIAENAQSVLLRGVISIHDSRSHSRLGHKNIQATQYFCM